VNFRSSRDTGTMTAECRTLTVSFCILLSRHNTMHTDYVEIPQLDPLQGLLELWIQLTHGF
jgi:hypothetical protein